MFTACAWQALPARRFTSTSARTSFVGDDRQRPPSCAQSLSRRDRRDGRPWLHRDALARGSRGQCNAARATRHSRFAAGGHGGHRFAVAEHRDVPADHVGTSAGARCRRWRQSICRVSSAFIRRVIRGTIRSFGMRRRARVFSGDLWLGVRARDVHASENPYEIIESLRRVAALQPARMFDAHRGLVEPAVSAIERKIEWLGELCRRSRNRSPRAGTMPRS